MCEPFQRLLIFSHASNFFSSLFQSSNTGGKNFMELLQTFSLVRLRLWARFRLYFFSSRTHKINDFVAALVGRERAIFSAAVVWVVILCSPVRQHHLPMNKMRGGGAGARRTENLIRRPTTDKISGWHNTLTKAVSSLFQLSRYCN